MIFGLIAIAALTLDTGASRIVEELKCRANNLSREQGCWDHSFWMRMPHGGSGIAGY